eukprot:GHVS01084698.1.p1 GENE.GHVS01084698.1~~GHVS01084698.1.p1  ORF type:complete len:335 (+),score=48.75 GHVS01084698.1:108-1112(+)
MQPYRQTHRIVYLLYSFLVTSRLVLLSGAFRPLLPLSPLSDSSLPRFLLHHVHPSFVLTRPLTPVDTDKTILTTESTPCAQNWVSRGSVGDIGSSCDDIYSPDHTWLIGMDFGFRHVGFAICPPRQFGYRNFNKDRKVPKKKQIRRITQIPPLLLTPRPPSSPDLISSFLIHISHHLPPFLSCPDLLGLTHSPPSLAKVIFVLGKPQLPCSPLPSSPSRRCSDLGFMVTVCRDVACALSATTGCRAVLVPEEFSSQVARASSNRSKQQIQQSDFCVDSIVASLFLESFIKEDGVGAELVPLKLPRQQLLYYPHLIQSQPLCHRVLNTCLHCFVY